MILVLSGEGGSDIGGSLNGFSACGPDEFKPGPISYFIDAFIKDKLGYSAIDAKCAHWVGRVALSQEAKARKRKPAVALPGAKSDKEMLAHKRAASALAAIALNKEKELNEVSIAILFHDSDGTNATINGRWARVVGALSQGFEEDGYSRGVAMVPNPKQEAWFLCAIKRSPYTHCHLLENESGNDSSPRSLKRQLSQELGSNPSSEDLIELLENGRIDPLRVNMPSLVHFRDRLTAVLEMIA